MKTIKDVIIENKELLINHENGYLYFYNYESYDYVRSKQYISVSNKDKVDSKYNQSYSKDELIKFQNILLKAYVYSTDLLDDAIKNSESKDLLDEIKRKVIATRKLLRNIVKYIDSYEELLENYKDV